MTNRLTRLYDAMNAQNLAALAVVPGANLRYLTGLDYGLSKRVTMVILPATGEPAMIMPRMEINRVEATSQVALKLYPWDDAEGPSAAMQRCLNDIGLGEGRIAVEDTTMRVFELRAIQRAAPAAIVTDATPLLAAMRMIKDSHELDAMRIAVHVIEDTLRATIAQIRVGMTELELAGFWEAAIRAAGCTTAFDLAVGSGPNGANPHHANGQRQFQPGDLIVLDGGAVYQGYASDITRTVAVGEPSAEARRIYDLVQAANAAGRAAVRPGATGEVVDHAARSVIEAGGYGPLFLHRTGHGLGMEVHEPPFMVGGSHEPLEPGMTFTIEPGIYVAGMCGVRIEDDIVVTADGGESLTSFERDLIII